jgi:hypothetical protein
MILRIPHFLRRAALILMLLPGGGSMAQEAGQEESPGGRAADKPFAYVQILNGISPPGVTLSINGRPNYPGIGPGARISSFGLPEQEWKIEVTKDGSDATKEFTLKFPREGFYTLVLTGDFAELSPVEDSAGMPKPDYRVEVSLLANKPPANAAVDVRIVNGTLEGVLQLLRDKRDQCAAGPGETATAPNQPAELFMEAVHDGSTIPLYIAQEPPVSNLTIVFYKNGRATAFRAMTERWGTEGVE